MTQISLAPGSLRNAALMERAVKGRSLWDDARRRLLQEGDVLSIDVGVSLDGYFGDSAVTLPVGQVSEEAATLLRVTEESLHKAIECVRPGGRVSDIGHAVQQHVEANRFSVVRVCLLAGRRQAAGERWPAPRLTTIARIRQPCTASADLPPTGASRRSTSPRGLREDAHLSPHA